MGSFMLVYRCHYHAVLDVVCAPHTVLFLMLCMVLYAHAASKSMHPSMLYAHHFPDGTTT